MAVLTPAQQPEEGAHAFLSVPLTSLWHLDQPGIAPQPSQALLPIPKPLLLLVGSRSKPHPPTPRAKLMPDLLQLCQEPLGLPEVVNYLAGALGLSERG